MRRLTVPPYAARNTLDLCIKSIRDKTLTAKLSAVAEEICEAETLYKNQSVLQQWFSIPQSLGVGDLSVEDMKRVYKNTFAKSAGTRNIYDYIKKLPVNDICPLCGQRTVGALDHYLAQSLHSALVVTPINLVPACNDCNKAKLDVQPIDAVEQTLHPYYDNVDYKRWLYATVEETHPATLRFFPDPPEDWGATLQQRIVNHFERFRLGSLYASHAGVELSNIQFGLRRIAEKGTSDQIRTELINRAQSAEAAQLNSWQTAMYHALAQSDWFCNGGYG